MKTEKSKNTTRSIIKEFNNKKIHYGLARNYEKYPNFDHDIDFFSSEHVEKIKKILINVAKKNDWDSLTHNIYFRNHLNNKAGIDTFHFYKYKNRKYEVLHLDFFRENLVIGLPFIKASNIKMNKHAKKEFFHINLNTENTIKLLTLNSHISNQNLFQKEYIKKKIKLYKSKIINFYSKNLKNDEIKKKNKLFFETQAVEFLKINNLKMFSFYINASRLLFFTKSFFLNPFSFFLNIFSRIIFFINIFFLNQPGLLINFYLDDKKQKKKVFNILNRLKSKNFIFTWKKKKFRSILTFEERKILERKGVVISFLSKPEKNHILIKKEYKLKKISELIIDMLIKKNQIIYKKNLMVKSHQ